MLGLLSERLHLRLFLISFITLFVELMLIRWVPSQVRLALQDMGEEIASDSQERARELGESVAVVERVGLAVSTALLAIITRASSLVAAVFSAVPMWGRVDPLAVLALSQKERKMRERKLRAAVDREDRYIGKLLDNAARQCCSTMSRRRKRSAVTLRMSRSPTGPDSEVLVRATTREAAGAGIRRPGSRPRLAGTLRSKSRNPTERGTGVRGS